MANEYDNIPVNREKQIYRKVQMIAESKGFGKRGAGALIEYWVDREMPKCEHPLVAITVEYFPGDDRLVSEPVRNGWFCATCNRVYQRVEALDRLEANAEPDPYGQPIVKTVKRRTQRVVRES